MTRIEQSHPAATTQPTTIGQPWRFAAGVVCLLLAACIALTVILPQEMVRNTGAGYLFVGMIMAASPLLVVLAVLEYRYVRQRQRSSQASFPARASRYLAMLFVAAGLCGMGIFFTLDAMGPLVGVLGGLLALAAVFNIWAGKGLPAKAMAVWQFASILLLATAAMLILMCVALSGAGKQHAIIPGYHLPWISGAVIISAYCASGFLLISRSMALPAATSQQPAATA